MDKKLRDEILDLIDKRIESLAIMIQKGFAQTATKDDIKDMVVKSDIKNMVVKDDIKNMVVKSDIKNMVVKDDIKNMVVKDDIKNMATKDDINRLEDRIERMDYKLTTFDKRISFLEDDYKVVRKKLAI